MQAILKHFKTSIFFLQKFTIEIEEEKKVKA